MTRIVAVIALFALRPTAATGVAQRPSWSLAELSHVRADGPHPHWGDTVVVRGRATLGSAILDTNRINIYIQSAGVGMHVLGDLRAGWRDVIGGDSVIATGVISRTPAGLQLTHASVAVIGTTRSSPPATLIAPLRASALDSSATLLVTITGIVSAARIGRGDHLLKILASEPRGDSTAVYVVEPDQARAEAKLERFEPEDHVRATGVLVRHSGSDTMRAQYFLLPRSAADIASIGLSRANRARIAGMLAAAFGLLIALGVALRVARVVRTERERAAAALRESEARYRLLVEQAPVGILVHRRGKILFANAALAAAIGAPDGESLVDTSLADLADPGDRARFTAWLTELAGREEKVKRGRQRFVRANGAPIEIAIVATPTIFGGEPAVQAVVHDVTAQGALEAQLRHAQKMEAVGQLAAGVAHDFNNILTAIAGYTQLILDEHSLGDAARKDVEEIQRAGTRAAVLTKQLLAVSRRQLVRAEVVDLNDVVATAEQLLRRTIGAQITLEVVPAGSPCSVLADRGQLEQILMNLVLNARDAMPHGGLLQVETRTVRVGLQSNHPAAVTPGDYASLSVRDTGVGMTAETLRRVFEPFFTTKAVGDGTGLGLATVYGIVTGAYGYVWAESTVGAGATFTVLLPLVARVSTSVAMKEHPPSIERGDVGCVLLVEDEAPVRAAARRILERAGHRVHEAKNASDALMLWEESGSVYDCVVTDVVMPGLRGPELVERLRIDRPDVPVLFVSGYTDRALGRLDLEVPNTSFLEKPFEPKQLAAAVAKLLNDREGVAA